MSQIQLLYFNYSLHGHLTEKLLHEAGLSVIVIDTLQHMRLTLRQRAVEHLTIGFSLPTNFGSFFVFALIYGCSLFMISSGVHAQQAVDDVNDSGLQRWGVTLDWIELELDESEATAADFNRYEMRLGALIDDVEQVKADVTEALDAPRLELEALGSPPKEGEPDEADAIKVQRGAISEQITALTQREKQAELMIVRAEQLLERLSVTQGERLQTRLLTRTSAIYTSLFWKLALSEAAQLVMALVEDARAVLDGERRAEWSAWLVLVLVLIAAMATIPGGRWLTRRFGRQLQVNESSYAQRTLSAFVEGVASGLPPAAVVGGTGLTLIKQGLIGEQAHTIVEAVTVSVVLAVSIVAPMKAALVSHAPAWRLISIDSAVAARLTRQMQRMIGFSAVILAFYLASARYRPYDFELHTLGKLVIALAVGAVLMSVLDSQFWRPGAANKPEDQPSRPLAALRRILKSVVIIAVGLALTGYVELSAFLVSRIALTVWTLGALILIRRLLHELLDRLIGVWQNFIRVERESSDSSLGFWLGSVLDLSLFAPVFLFLSSAWGLPQTVIYLWSRRLLDGVTIGDLTLSPGRILMAVLVFSVVFVATRLLRRIIYDRVLPETPMDFGLRHSVYVGIGYVGLALAAILAVVTLGVGINNLVLVFGALSVGIGLGLQGVVSNFMSGLILLAQRPIRVGDWIEVSGHEGIVRNIKGVSTEIETFDKASIIIPNGDLVSNSVVNWTHTDRTVRVIISIGVAYGSDIHYFQELLLECAAKHNEVMTTPKPYALFVDFGDSALLFELRVFVRDAERYHIVSSQLRCIIDQACRDSNIEIPYPQRRLHINRLDNESATRPNSADPGTGAN